MKNIQRKMICIILGALLCFSLSGCTIGEYAVCDFYTDENGDLHFMMFGKHNMGEAEDEISESAENLPEIEDSMAKIKSLEKTEAIEGIRDNNSDSTNITATTLKSGWTSSDNSILKGTNVSVKEDSTLFLINMKQEKEVTISYDIQLSDGEYQLIYISSDGTEQILEDEQTAQSDKQILLAQGKNKIVLVSDNTVFKKIDIAITGIEVSDFN